MKYLIMCEGPNELTVLNLLLQHDRLKFREQDLLGLNIFHARQFVAYIINEVKTYGKEDIKVIRVGDKLYNEVFKIPKPIKDLIKPENILLCRTIPELEMLLIISEGLFDKYNKVKSKKKPKTYALENVKLGKCYYNETCAFWKDYYSDVNKLVEAIKECKRLTKVNKGDIYLADLLK